MGKKVYLLTSLAATFHKLGDLNTHHLQLWHQKPYVRALTGFTSECCAERAYCRPGFLMTVFSQYPHSLFAWHVSGSKTPFFQGHQSYWIRVHPRDVI